MRNVYGSPPLTRGILSNSFFEFELSRFTPAHAGNTKTIPFYADPTGVHPRSRGEYIKRTSKCNAGIGSPPLTRGIPADATLKSFDGRFTPAHAGNTFLCNGSFLLPWVHPRSRGEYTKKSLILSHFFQHPFSHFI